MSLAHPRPLARVLVLLLSTLVSRPVCAEDLEQQFLDGRHLRPQEDEARVLEALETSRPRGRPADKPVIHADSSIQFTFGASRPVVICAPLQVCDIELQPGERVRSVQVGDAVRWAVEPAVTGVAPREVQHVIIKPSDVGLRTSLVVATDRRTYRLKLVSHRSEYMASVSFAYPSDGEAKWAELAEAPAGPGRPRSDRSLRARGQKAGGSLRALSFNYEIEGDDPPWKPVRVYNDGLQTVIEMPFAMRQTEAPTLLVVRAEGGLFTKDDVVQVNFHTEGTRYLVDMVFDVADLVVGVGSSQQRVRIRRK